jgi:hypothetical protein
VNSWTRNQAVVFLSMLGVFLFKPSATVTANARPKRVLILDSFGRDVAPFNEEGSGDG